MQSTVLDHSYKLNRGKAVKRANEGGHLHGPTFAKPEHNVECKNTEPEGTDEHCSIKLFVGSRHRISNHFMIPVNRCDSEFVLSGILKAVTKNSNI